MRDTGNGLPRANRTQMSVGFDGRTPVTESAYHRYAQSGMFSFKSGGTAKLFVSSRVSLRYSDFLFSEETYEARQTMAVLP